MANIAPPRSRRRMVRPAHLLSVLICVLIVLLPTAGRAATPAHPADSPQYGGTLVFANQVDADSIDPAGNPVNEVIWIDANLYEKLVQASPDGTKILPQLAESWDVSNGGLTYTFHLRAARFQNGMPVTSQDVKYSLERAIAYKGGWGFLLAAVKNIAAPAPRTVVINLKYRWAPILADLAIYANSIMPASLLKKEGKKFFDHPIGSGPYEFVTWHKGDYMLLQRNPYWWGPKPYLDQVKFAVVPNDNTRVLQLQGKQTDIAENPPGNLLPQIQANPALQAYLFPSTRVDFIQLDEHFKPFRDKRIRQAINYAIDRNALVKLALAGHGQPATSFMPPMLYWDPNLKGYPYNLAKAKQLMAQSTYPHGFKCFLITVSNDVVGNAVAVIMKAELAQIGVDVSITPYELITAYQKEDGGHSQMGERYWTNDIIDPDEVVSFAVDPNAGAHSFSTWYNNPTVVKLVHQAQQELDPNKRREMYYRIQEISNADAPLINLFYSPYRYASGAWVHGFHVSPIGVYQLQNIWLSSR